MNIPAAGGTAIPFRTESNIIAADYSPDSKQLAAMIMQENGLADLYILRPFGLGGGNAILKGISGVKSLIWQQPEVIFFNAISVGEQVGKAFWEVNPQGEIVRALTGYSDPKNVSYFSRQRSDLTPYVPEPDIIIPPPLPLPDDITDKILASPVMILSPKNGDVVRGAVPLRIISRQRTAKVVIRINGQLIYAESTANFGERQNVDIPRLTYFWNTQGIRPPGPFSSLPASYRELQNYPDAGYAICVQGVDESDRLIGQQIITVQVRNEVERPADENTFDLQYSAMKERSQEIYQLNASANLFDADAHLSSSLNANLQVFLQRTVDIVLPNGNIGLRTTITSPEKRYPLIYGENAVDIPESARAVYGAYSLTPFGDILLATLQNEKIYLPIAQLSVPLKGSRVTVGDSWQKAMMVVPELFTRESNTVAARHTLEGIEWIDNRQMARIRSEFVLDKFTTLYPMPANSVPGEQGDRTALIKKLNSIIIPNAPPDPLTTIQAISVQRAAGVRYSWFDLQTQKIWRIEDIIIITIPAANIPDLPRTTLTTGEVSETVWYQVRLQYQLEEPRLPVN